MGECALPPVYYNGSVKKVRGIPGESLWYFEFSDSYSVFDWGIMPDHLENKGIAQAQFARIIFEYLTKRTDIKTTFLGMEKKHMMKIRPVSLLRPQFKGYWDYSAYQEKPCNVLLPLEVLFRFGVPKGSSFLKRATKEYCHFLGLPDIPQEGDFFDDVVVEFTSKLEEEDRFVDYKEAREMAGLSEDEFICLLHRSKKLAVCLRELFTRIGLDLWDGKFEFAIGPMVSGQREFLLADSVGPDELRLGLLGYQLSKENIRQYYRGSDWHMAVVEAKKMARVRGVYDWREICRKEMKKTPLPLPQKNKEVFSMIYQVLTNALAQEWEKEIIFPQAWDRDHLKYCLKQGDLP